MFLTRAMELCLAPMCICDMCGRQITEAFEGMALYPSFEPLGDESRLAVMHVHKGECLNRAEKSFGRDGTEELSVMMVQLMMNMGLSGERLWRLMKRVEEIGM